MATDAAEGKSNHYDFMVIGGGSGTVACMLLRGEFGSIVDPDAPLTAFRVPLSFSWRKQRSPGSGQLRCFCGFV